MKLDTADLIVQAMTEQRDVGKRLVTRTGGLCQRDHSPLYALTGQGTRLYERLSIPICLKCGLAYHPLNGLGSRDFDGVDDIIDCGSPAALDDVNPFTYLAWANLDSAGEGDQGIWIDKGAQKWLYNLQTVANSVSLYVARATTAADARGAANTVVYSSWMLLAATFSEADGPRIYKGTPVTALAEVSYNQRQVGVGAATSDAAGNFYIGNDSTTAYTADGKLAQILIFNRILTLNEMIGCQFGYLITNGLVGYWPLWGVATPEPDLSGNVNSGTVTGALNAVHAPIGRYAEMRRAGPSCIANVEYINITDSGVGTDTIVGIEEWLTITDTGVGTDVAYILGEVLIDGLNLEHALTIHITEPTTISSKPIPDELPSRTYLGKQGRNLEINGWVPTVAKLNMLSALADGTIHYVQLPTGTRVPVHIVQVQPTRPTEPNEYPYVISAVEVAE